MLCGVSKSGSPAASPMASRIRERPRDGRRLVLRAGRIGPRQDVDRLLRGDVHAQQCGLDLGVDGLRVQVASAGATVDVYELRLDGIEAELRDDLPIRTGFSWAAVDTGFSGDGSIEGSLRGLELEHELYGQYPMRSSGSNSFNWTRLSSAAWHCRASDSSIRVHTQ